MSDIKFSLINLDGLSELGQSLLDKISNAIGWIATKNTPKRIAIQTYIEEIKNGNYDPITKAVLISNAKKTIAEYSNQNSIVQHAIANMNDTAHPELVENDWISQFMDKARLVSDSDFQLIWGRILAEECNIPGSVPRSLLHTLEQMDRNDAEKFTKLASFSIFVMEDNNRNYSPVIIEKHLRDYYTKRGVDFDSLIDLQALGLIKASIGMFTPEYCSTCSTAPIVVHYYGKQHVLPSGIFDLPVGNVIFTKTGQALCQAIETEEQEGFFEQYYIPFLNERLNKNKP